MFSLCIVVSFWFMTSGDKNYRYFVNLNCVAETFCFSLSSITLTESIYDVLIPQT